MKAALYLRSSKDRSDVSLAAQRHELEKLAASRSLTIVRAYEDAVESGSTEDRPGFAALVRALKDPQRGWSHLLVYDTSRLARRRYIAQAIKHEAKKRGVTIRYARLPADLDPVAEIVLESVFEAMDEAHSLMSREKGLAGMAENVRRGWRAGGRAPFGYRLEVHATGAIRDGRPVTKSKLVPSESARAVAGYLKARAAGTPRCVALAESDIDRAGSTMICVEWNALTYAGHTVWNRHAPEGAGRKRRARGDWLMTPHTHPALISDAEAEAILAQLETSEIGAAVSRAKASLSSYLLTGLLVTPEGQAWVGHGRYYRLKACDASRGRLVRAELVDRAVLAQVRTDLASDLFLRRLCDKARDERAADPAASIETRLRALEREKSRAATLALTNDSDTFLALVADRARQIDALRREAEALRADDRTALELSRITPDTLRTLLAEEDPGTATQALVERVVLSPSLDCRLHYRAAPGSRQWLSVASPADVDRYPHELTRRIQLRAA